MANPFRAPTMRQHYDGAMKAYKEKHPALFVKGQRRGVNGISLGSSFATSFWYGYDGKVFGIGWDAASKKTIAYPVWCAGRDCAKADAALGIKLIRREA